MCVRGLVRIGVFGKSGSGKTTAAKFFEKKGFHRIDLDEIGRSAVTKYPDIREKVAEMFGNRYLTPDGLDRPALGRLVFSSVTELEKLNSIFFPYIREDAENEIKRYRHTVTDGAVLFDIGLFKIMDKVIYVKTSVETAVYRLMKRKGADRQTVTERLERQSCYDTKSMAADLVITTDGTVEELYNELEKVFEKEIRKLM